MSDLQYSILAYALGLGMLLGYAGVLWCSLRRCGPRAAERSERTNSRS